VVTIISLPFSQAFCHNTTIIVSIYSPLTPKRTNAWVPAQQALAAAARNSALEELHLTQLSSEEKTEEPRLLFWGAVGGIGMFKK